MKTKLLILLLVLGLPAAALAYFLTGRVDVDSLIVVPVAKGDLQVKLRSTGKLEAEKSTRITTNIAWQSIVFLAPEGQLVKKGDKLVEFAREELEEQARNARAELRVSEARLEEAKKALEAARLQALRDIEMKKADLAIAQLELHNLRSLPRPDDVKEADVELRRANAVLAAAKEEYDRLVRLSAADVGIVLQQDMRETKQAYEKAKGEQETATLERRLVLQGAHPDEIKEAELKVSQCEIKLAQTEKGLPEQTKQLEATVEKAKAEADKFKNQLQKREEELRDTEIKAPEDGMVVYRIVETKKIAKGMKVWKGSGIMDLPNLSKMIIKAKVRESQIDLVAVGQTASIQVDALPGRVFTGKVTEKGKVAKDITEGEVVGWGEARADSGVKIFDVTVTLDQSDPEILRPNLITRIEILASTLKGVTYVPTDAVAEKDGKKTASVYAGGRLRPREVKVGQSVDDLVVITEGLQPGERVCLGPKGEAASGRKPVTKRGEKGGTAGVNGD
ncbi:MAG: efflux RND transporter periplasmic adaptor subunit [Planctomycetes bacterium]|nr:efflux RND transporter periplasmic adaptor subunit [Planctomycetota bacterium]